MTLSDADRGYGGYSQDPDYIAVNRALIDTIALAGVERVADLACGTGLLSGLLLEREPKLAICGIDLDPDQIALARKNLGMHHAIAADLAQWRATGAGSVYLRVESVERLPFAAAEIDLVVMGNAIHLMPDRAAFLAEVRRVIAPDGAFVFNSAFYVGTFAPGTEPLYTEWLKHALVRLEDINRQRASEGLPPVARRRGTMARAFSKGWLGPEAWQAALEEAGFRMERRFQRAMPLTREGLRRVAAYGGLAEVLMSGYPVEVSSQCLQEAVDPAFDTFGADEVARSWLEITAAPI